MTSTDANPLLGRFTKSAGVFVTGTDTGVGKTVIAGAIARLLADRGRRVGVFKPVATGGRIVPAEGIFSADTEFLAWAADTTWNLATITPVAYAEPLSPLDAAKRAARPVDLDAIVNAYNLIAADSEFLVVEGIGGLLVPITRQVSVRDIAAAMGLPLVIVARPTLGTINHTLLTLEAARVAGLDVAAIVINMYDPHSQDPSAESNPVTLAELTGLEVVIVPNADATTVDPKPALDEMVLACCQELLPLLESDEG